MSRRDSTTDVGGDRSDGASAAARRRSATWVRWIEWFAWGAGLLLLAVWVAAWSHRTVSGANDIRKFREARLVYRSASVSTDSGSAAIGAPDPESVDFTLWSESRIRHYEQTLRENLDPPLALLRIPSIDLEVPVHDGVGELILNRAVGRIDGTARPGEPGNLGVAGHRDGFFRGLKDVRLGDEIELETLSATYHYRVDELLIVMPTDTEVLEPTAEPTITLVTCYPFYHVGSAPKRFIVRASLDRTSP